MKKIIFLIPSILLLASAAMYAQPCAKLANQCFTKLKPFNSDGQYNHALLLEGETAEFETTFYAGGDYRIVTCTGPNNDTLQYNVYDSKYNLLFSNEDHNYAQSWNFKFKSSDRYIIQATLKEGTGSGCAVVLIGFKE